MFQLVWSREVYRRIREERSEEITYCITTSHALARELLSKPDGFLTATFVNDSGREVEFIITDYQRKKGHANVDDSVPYWTLNLKDGGNGNLKKY